MGEVLHKRLLTSRFENSHHEALLNVLVASSHLYGLLDAIFAGEDLTTSQHNVLRILNGAYPGGYARSEIARRMVERAPDLTRLIDRLVRRGLAQRTKSPSDGRHSIARITPKGREVLARVLPRVRAVNKQLAKKLTEKEAAELSRLLEKVYEPE